MTDDQLIANEADSNNYQLVDDEGNVIGDTQNNKSLWDLRNRHFKNRLFDRDTLLLQVYNVNFLYVLKAYTSKRSGLRDEFKKKARDKFRRNFVNLLDEKYYFWALFPKPQNKEELDSFVEDNFKKLIGRVFRPHNSAYYLIFALERTSVDNSERDYLEIYKAVNAAIENDKMEIFNVKPQELWADGALVEYLRNNPGWE